MRVICLPSYRSMLQAERNSLHQRYQCMYGSNTDHAGSTMVHSLYLAAGCMLLCLPAMYKVLKRMSSEERYGSKFQARVLS